MWYASATATGAAAVLFVVTTQSFIAHQRAKDASQAAARLRSALRYISHEARSPLGGAILSLSLISDAIDESNAAESKALLGDLHTAAGAASRHPASTVWRRSAFTSHAAPAPAVEPIEAKVLVIEVLDNGKGIPAEMLRPGRLFRPFQQLRMGDSALRMTSSGLGLSIVKSVVVDQMGGDVGLASREEEGTLFFARVPVWARRCGGEGDGEGEGEGCGADDGVEASTRGEDDGSEPREAASYPPSASPPSSKTCLATDVSRREHGQQSGDAAVTPGSQSREDRQGRRERRLAKRSGERRAGNDGAPPLPLAWVVDDERVNRTLMARVIRKWGFEVLEFGDGAELVEAVEGVPPADRQRGVAGGGGRDARLADAVSGLRSVAIAASPIDLVLCQRSVADDGRPS
ncbi:hypothetical protein FNF28_06172 [Cafeteria roenbergensis]|uniref:histidine kinase n=1 Tax=Cafeteria roenbergensis TaxID=33653 RepID=A0A5A8D3S0_CAFRO|nr:hypothetical protein FNF28_06172 [Cafeteria roenbergensis]